MTNKITERQKGMLNLIHRSPDIGGGWRRISELLWPLVVDTAHPDLTEIDATNRRIRFTAEGETVMRYLA